MNRKWLAIFIILAIILFATSWLLPKDPPKAPPVKTGSAVPGAAAHGVLASVHRLRARA